jgi:hypothetical protein
MLLFPPATALVAASPSVCISPHQALHHHP